MEIHTREVGGGTWGELYKFIICTTLFMTALFASLYTSICTFKMCARFNIGNMLFVYIFKLSYSILTVLGFFFAFVSCFVLLLFLFIYLSMCIFILPLNIIFSNARMET